MAFKDCMASIKTAMGGKELSDSEWDRITTDLTKVIDKHRAKGADQLGERVMAELAERADNERIANIIQQRNALFNRRAQIELQNYVKTVWKDSPKTGMEAFLVGKQRNRKGSLYSVGQDQVSTAETYLAGLHSDMLKAKVWDYFKTGELDKDIYIARHRLDSGEVELSDMIPEAVSAAKIINKHTEFMRLEFNRVGGAIGKLDGWVTSRTHNSEKIRKDSEGWLKFMEENLDIERVFDDIPPDVRLSKLKQERAEFMSGVHIALLNKDGPKTSLSGMTGLGNVGKGMSKERVYHFKTPDAEFEYNQRFGNGSLSQAVFFHAERMAADTALMRRLGPNAKMNLDAVFDSFLKDAKVQEDPKMLHDLKAYKDHVDRVTWKHLSGQSRAVAVGGELLAKVDSVVRVGQQMASLGGALLSMPPDLANLAGEFRHQGRGFLSGLNAGLKDLAKLTTDPEVREAMQSAGILSDYVKGSAISRFDQNDLFPGMAASVQNTYMNWTGIKWWPDRLRDGFAASMANHMAMLADKPFSQMDVKFKNLLRSYGIEEGDWEVMSKGVHETSTGLRLMTPEAIVDQDDSVFSKALSDKGVTPSPSKITSMRMELSSKIRTMMQDRASMAVVEGNIRTREVLPGSAAEQGTWERVMYNQISLFKTFVFGVVEGPVKRELFGGSEALDWRSAMKESKGLMNLAKTMTASTLLGYVAVSLKDIGRGKEPPDPLDPGTIMRSIMLGGTGGIYVDTLLGEAAKYDGGVVESLLGPTAGDINDLGELTYKLLHGEPAAAKAFKFVINNLPGNNVFYTKWALDYLFLYQISESLSPGYLRRMERNLKKKGDQEMFFPPSRNIPHGGGNKLLEGVR